MLSRVARVVVIVFVGAGCAPSESHPAISSSSLTSNRIPNVGPEIEIGDLNLHGEVQFGGLRDATAASSGSKTMVVWNEPHMIDGFNAVGALIRPDGTLLRPAFVIRRGVGTYWFPRLTGGSNGFLSISGSDVFEGGYAVRMTQDGTALDSPAIDVGRFQIAVFDGQDYVLSDCKTFRKLSVAGPLGPVSPTTMDWTGSCVMASNGSRTLWIPVKGFSGPPVFNTTVIGVGPAYVLDSSLNPVAGPIVVSGLNSKRGTAAVASDGTSFLVVWPDYRGGGMPAIYGTRIDADGNVLDGLDGIRIADPGGEKVSVAWDGSRYIVSWFATDDRTRLKVRRVGADGVPDGPVQTPNLDTVSDRLGSWAVAATSEGAIAVFGWTGKEVTPGVVLPRAPADLSSPASFSLDKLAEKVPTRHKKVSVIGNATNFVASWLEFGQSPFTEQYYARRLDENGAPLGASVATGVPVNIKHTNGYGSIQQPGASYSRTGFDFDLNVTLASTPIPKLVSCYDFFQSLNTTNKLADSVQGVGSWLIAVDCYYSNGPNGPERTVHVSGADKDGQRLPDTILAATGGRLAFNGSKFIVVGYDERPAIVASIINPDGTSATPSGILVSTVNPTSGNYPGVASDGQSFVVTWTDGGSVWARRISVDGDLLGAARRISAVASAPVYQNRVVFDGHRYLAAWTSGTFSQWSPIQLMWLDPQTLEPYSDSAASVRGAFSFDDSGPWIESWDLAANANGRGFLAYLAFDRRDAFRLYRARGRVIGGPEVIPSDGGAPPVVGPDGGVPVAGTDGGGPVVSLDGGRPFPWTEDDADVPPTGPIANPPSTQPTGMDAGSSNTDSGVPMKDDGGGGGCFSSVAGRKPTSAAPMLVFAAIAVLFRVTRRRRDRMEP